MTTSAQSVPVFRGLCVKVGDMSPKPDPPGALVALIVFGIVLIFVHIPGGSLIYSVLGLVIFAGFTMFSPARKETEGP
jgi:hypothetical protein